MTAPGPTATGPAAADVWSDVEFAKAWLAKDTQGDLLALPRRIAAALVEGDRPGTALVLDIASGAGPFLAAFLDTFPEAHGFCTDASPTMVETARDRLAGYADRVTYQLADMTDLASAGLPTAFDAITTSRASHHLKGAPLADFYRGVTAHLAPGGWFANLDHVGPPAVWDARLRAAKKRLFPSQGEGGPKHHHDYPLASVDEHLAALAAAGLPDARVAWSAFHTCLIMARRSDGSDA
ncbi:MAG TPA: class I SAM-dependent methyltransferase [Micromonosporaceae bacterium]|nr:class I SAM-dependent methyltransferase [Micromonosporaceae bacterium]